MGKWLYVQTRSKQDIIQKIDEYRSRNSDIKLVWYALEELKN